MRPTTALILGVLCALLLTVPAGAREYAVWGGCAGGAELLKPLKVQHCSRDVTYSLYVDRLQWAAFGDAEATGTGVAYVNPCDVSCGYGVWQGAGSASVTLSRPRACGDRLLYTHGLIQLQDAYDGRTAFEEDYPCELVVRRCGARLYGGALRAIAQRATTCTKATRVARAWVRAAGYRVLARPRASVSVGAYRCRRSGTSVACRASGKRLVTFRAR